ncbi:hypothetical protein M0802_005851 [Mischocyttarus mexicanus]|nr:hypothetical protein M0802_005851 [Mischocyttarus mexicanus]
MQHVDETFADEQQQNSQQLPHTLMMNGRKEDDGLERMKPNFQADWRNVMFYERNDILHDLFQCVWGCIRVIRNPDAILMQP